jgi:enediyne biosynthesis protein E4
MPHLFHIVAAQAGRIRVACTRVALALIVAAATWGGAGCNNNQPPAVSVSTPEEPKKDFPQGPPLFEDVTTQTGIDFTYRNGEEANNYAIIESLGGGVALIDYDGDGRLDIFFTGGGYYEGKKVLGHPCRLYRNLGNWKFQDVSKEAGLDAIQPCFTHGAAVFDYDNDGWPDILLTGYNHLVLLHNEPAPDGKGRRFVDVTEKAGLTEKMWSSCAAWGDLDGDGYPELYISHYGNWGFDTNHPTDCTYDGKTRDVCQPKRFDPLPHLLYRNNRNGTFTDITNQVKLRPGGTVQGGKGMTPMMADLNGDGRPDIYVANDTDDNFLYMNRGKRGEIVLEETGLLAGVARDERGTPNGSMGVDVGDFDRSGRPSIIVTNYENELPALYQNISDTKRESFNFATISTGIGAIGGNYVGWGVGFIDFDHDGWEDLLLVNGHAIRYPNAKFGRKQKPVLLHNERGRFKAITPEGGPYFREVHNARGAAFGDLDNDGKIDVVISHLNEPVTVLRNVSPDQNHWVGFELVGEKNRDLVGARIEVESGGVKRTRFTKGGGSFASSSDRRHVFGLGGEAKPVKVKVTWPWGNVQEWEGLAADRYWRLVEGKGEAEKPAYQP